MGLTWSFGTVHVEGEFGVPDELLRLSRGRGPLQEILRLLSAGKTTALFEKKNIQGTDGENLSVPVVDGDAVCFGEFGGWKAFHAGSGGDIRFWDSIS